MTKAGRLPKDTCDRDPIWDREVETESQEAAFLRASTGWEKQLRHVMEHSPFYARRFHDAGVRDAGGSASRCNVQAAALL